MSVYPQLQEDIYGNSGLIGIPESVSFIAQDDAGFLLK